MLIHSRSNPKIKHIRQLAQSKARQKSAAFVVEGRVLVTEALHNGWQAEHIFVTEGTTLPKETADLYHTASVDILTPDLMNYASQLRSATDVLAIFKQRDISEDPCRASAWFLADRLQDPGNFGALFRLADALNWRGILAYGPTPDPFQMKVIRGSMGASLRLPVISVNAQQLKTYQQANWHIVGTAAEAEAPSTNCHMPKQVILALGHEGQGLHSELRELADTSLAIPIHARMESLNVVTAGAMLAHEYLRQHGLQEVHNGTP